MNIKITKNQSDFILSNNINYLSFVIGSHLYGTNNENSDKDYLIIYDNFHKDIDLYYPNNHQFQHDDIENNTQLIFTTKEQFYRNLFSGDSTINADVILFSDFDNWNSDEKLNILRTFNIIKAFIGFAKRDIKSYKQGKGKHKLFHIERSLYCAECLLNNKLPSLTIIQSLVEGISDLKYLEVEEIKLRTLCNKLYENNDLTTFPKLPIKIYNNNDSNGDSLKKLLIESNNIKEFKY